MKSSPGTLLRKAREQAGMSVQDVAQELRLSSSQVQSLEDDFYEDLPGMTYVRGYLRSYARLMKVDESAVVPPPPEVETVTTDSGSFAPVAPRQARSSDRPMRVGTIVVLLATLGGLIAWWQSRDNGSQPALSLGTESKQIADRVAITPSTAVSPPAAMPAPETVPAPLPVAADPPLSEAATPATPAAGSDAPITAGEAPSAEKKVVAVAPSPAPKTKVTPQVKPKPAPDSGRIEFSFDGTSWVDVRDANDERLLYQSVTEGRSITVQGKPPFRVFVGNAKAVRIQYAGRAVDVSAHQTGAFARFVLGNGR